MPKLSKLHLSVAMEYVEDFTNVFEEASLTLPNIKTLVIGRFNDFIIRHCPNVQTISTNGYSFQGADKFKLDLSSHLINEASKPVHLTYFEMNLIWRTGKLEGQSYSPEILYFSTSTKGT